MFKSIILLISTLILFSGCHRSHPVVAAPVIVPAVIISPAVYRPFRGDYRRGSGFGPRHHGPRHGHGGHRGHRR